MNPNPLPPKRINPLLMAFMGCSVMYSAVLAEPTLGALQVRAAQESAAAKAWAKKNQYPERSAEKAGFQAGNSEWGLVGFSNQPRYYTTLNENAAISTATNLVRQTAPYGVAGVGLSIGIWDGGSVLQTHDELTSRVVNMDSSVLSAHATHVGGTLAATGINPLAKGMAPGALLLSSDFMNDFVELIPLVAGNSTEALVNSQKITVSNHSYGDAVGWIKNVDFSGTNGAHWMDDLTNLIDPDFGRYGESAQNWDLLTYQNPYWLPFISAGNDRDDTPPSTGATFFYFESATETWLSAVYDPLVHAGPDFSKGGYDTIITSNGSKNVMTVGAVNDAVSGGLRSLASATITNFSGWGPMDDGRIKPDIVANGASLLSVRFDANDTYLNASGTSMSSPNAAGSALLLQDYYSQLYNQTMPANLLKGLIIHTADDLGRPGPDYEFGWGLMNTEAAAAVIKAEFDDAIPRLIEGVLSAGNPVQQYNFVFADSAPCKVTLCWVDPPGAILTGLDNPTPALVNDLDLRVQDDPVSQTYLPFTLDPMNPASLAVPGDNFVDNVEQVIISSPGVPNRVGITVSYKGVLNGAEQPFALIVTGAISQTLVSDWMIF